MKITQQNVMPHQLATFIESVKQKITKTCRMLELYEMQIDLIEGNLAVKNAMKKNFALLMENNKVANRQIRKQLSLYEKILKTDEEINGWKGTDRWVDFEILQESDK